MNLNIVKLEASFPGLAPVRLASIFGMVFAIVVIFIPDLLWKLIND